MRLKLNSLPNKVDKQLQKFAPPPQPTVKATSTKTRAYTYFTKPTGQTELLYTAEGWIHVRLLLENAGPVSIGMDQNITPVLSGKGRLLPTGQEIRFSMTRGDRLFIAAEAKNRVSFVVEPLLPVDRIAMAVEGIFSMASAFLGRK